MKMILATVLSVSAAGMALAGPVGHAAFSVEAPHHGRMMAGAIWYPAAAGGRAGVVEDNAVFEGVAVVEDAALRDGVYPVVLLSHGLGGNIRSLPWLAAGLAERGVISVSVNHPNSTSGNFDLAAGLRHWTRVQDLSLALDRLSADPKFRGHLDDTRIMAAGFSYGGWTALSMGGLRGNHAGYTAHCRAHPEASSHCRDLVRGGIDLTDVDAAAWDAPHGDPRITRVAAIDPGLVWGLEPADVRGLIGGVHLIGLGEGADRLFATDFGKSGLADLLADAWIEIIAPAAHVTAMPLCKPAGAAILREEEDDPVCTDPAGTDRATVHARIVESILSDLE